MSFVPALPIGGYAGWRFLNRTMEAQQAAFARSPTLQRDTAYFREKIGQIDSAEALVADRRLLRIALGAFGLEGEIDSRFLIRKVLEEGTLDPKSLANRLTDKRFAEFSRAFGFDLGVPRSKISTFADRIVSAYETRQFEVAIGNQDDTMRLALNLRRELAELAGTDRSERIKWFTVLGTPPLRKAFETAFGLPAGFGAVDLERQLGVMQTRARAAFGEGTVAQFADPERMEKLVQRFLLRADLEGGAISATARGSAALQLLQAAAPVGALLPGPLWR